MKSVGRYDSSIETKSDFRDKNISRPEDVFGPIADIKNIKKENANMVVQSRKLVKELKHNDFQRRY